MEKEFVTYQQALRLKALGFDEPCFTYHHGGFLEFCLDGHNNVYERKNSSFMRSVSAPTFSQAFAWFRDKYNIHSSPRKYNETKWWVEWGTWTSPVFERFEEAESAWLDKLIELTFKSE